MQITRAIVRIMLGILAVIMLLALIQASREKVSTGTKVIFFCGFITEILALILLWN